MSDLLDWTSLLLVVPSGAIVSDASDWTTTVEAVSGAGDVPDWTLGEVGAAGGSGGGGTGIFGGSGGAGQFVSASEIVTGITTVGSLAVPMPPGANGGNLLLAFVLTYLGSSSPPTVTPPAGWATSTALNYSDAALNYTLYTKTDSGSEPATYTWHASPNCEWAAVVIAWSGLTVGVDGGSATHIAIPGTAMPTLAFTAGNQPDTILLVPAGSGGVTGGVVGPSEATFLTGGGDFNSLNGIWAFAVPGPLSTSVPSYTSQAASNVGHVIAAAVGLH